MVRVHVWFRLRFEVRVAQVQIYWKLGEVVKEAVVGVRVMEGWRRRADQRGGGKGG